jgi:hypothetical protein
LKPETAVAALNALSGGVTGFIYAPNNAPDRRQAAVQMSFLLRRAFSVSADQLEDLPMQLGADFDAARVYMMHQAQIWAAGPELRQLFHAAGLSDIHAHAIQAFLPTILPFDQAAMWLCREFGDLRAEREAAHCRRYVATWLTRALLDDTGRAQPVGRLDASTLQARIDDWSNPIGRVENTLHFERIVQPILKRIAELAKLAAASSSPISLHSGDRS